MKVGDILKMGRVRYKVKEINFNQRNRSNNEARNYSEGAIIRTGAGIEEDEGHHARSSLEMPNEARVIDMEAPRENAQAPQQNDYLDQYLDLAREESNGAS